MHNKKIIKNKLATSLHSKLFATEDLEEEVLQLRRAQIHQAFSSLLSCGLKQTKTMLFMKYL